MFLFLFALRGVFKRYSEVFNDPSDKTPPYAMYKGFYVHIEGDDAKRQDVPLYYLRVGTHHFYAIQEDVAIRKDPAKTLVDVTLRETNNSQSKVLKLIKANSDISVNDVMGDYLYIEHEGTWGYIPWKSCDHKEPWQLYPGKNDGERAAKIVETKIGCPYLLINEATGPFIFDCSGLMKYAYNLLDIFLHRTASAQIYGKEIPIDDMSQWLPGDVITFATDPDRPNSITHVGMYVGNGEFIHASTNQYRVRRQVYKDYDYKTMHVSRYFEE